MLRMILLTLLLALLVGSCAGTGQQTQTESQGNFYALCRNIDTNHDGRISREEMRAAAHNKDDAEAFFDMCDVDRQGAISYDQAYDANRSQRLQQVIRITTPRP